MPSYPIMLTISNPHSKVPISATVHGVDYPVATETKSVEDLFNIEGILNISIVVE